MYNQSKGLTFFLLAAVGVASGLAALGVWYEVFYVTADTGPETVKAISMNIGGAVATTLLTMGIMEVVMVLSRYIIEQYRKERDARMKAEGEVAGRARGREEMAQRWQDWNNRRLAAEGRGEPFDEPPPPAITRED